MNKLKVLPAVSLVSLLVLIQCALPKLTVAPDEGGDGNGDGGTNTGMGGGDGTITCGENGWDDDEDSSTACVAFATCAPGTFIEDPGDEKTDRECEACQNGFTSSENREACTPFTECGNGMTETMPGNPTADRTCEDLIEQNDPTCQDFTTERVSRISPPDAAAVDLLAQLTTAQKVDLMNGGPACPSYDCDFGSQGVPSSGVEEMHFWGGTRGVNTPQSYPSTTWAVAAARAASFDKDLEYRVGEATGLEMRSLKGDVLVAPLLSPLRHPRWARAQETYGEDPFLVGEMGAAFIRGAQNHVPACPMGYVAHTTDNNRNAADVVIDDQTLHENYLLPFEIAVKKADPACIQAAYNSVSGEWMSSNKPLLTEVLRDDWGWEGVTVTSWWGTSGAADAAELVDAGLDLEMPAGAHYYEMASSVGSGIPMASVDAAALRILNVRSKFGQLDAEYHDAPLDLAIVDDTAHQALALETAEKGAVLLKNDGLLPLGPVAEAIGSGTEDISSIVVLGPDANFPIESAPLPEATGLGDQGSSKTVPPYVVTFADGLQDAAPSVNVTTSAMASAASSADVAVIPVVLGHGDEGEAFAGGGDRTSFALSTNHPVHWASDAEAFIQAAAAENPNVIVLLVAGGPIDVGPFESDVAAIIHTFYPGQEGGTALARLIFGQTNFSGKLPFTVGMAESQYPAFENTGSVTTIDFYHGYRRFEAQTETPRFWFGYGLSYTTYEYSGLMVLCDTVSTSGRLNAQVDVENTGMMAGTEVVQIYLSYPGSENRRPEKELKTFTRVALEPGEKKTVQFSIPAEDMAFWSSDDDAWTLEPGTLQVIVAGSAAPTDSNLLSADFTLE